MTEDTPLDAAFRAMEARPDDEAARLRVAGFDFYDWAPGEIRLVTSWDQGVEAIRPLADAIAAL